VVTWKGYVMSQLSQGWVELRRIFLRVGRYLLIQWEVVCQRTREQLESARLAERLATLHPMVRRHGALASVALLCCAILLLGLTATSDDPATVSTRPANAATVTGAENAPNTATFPLGALPTPNGAVVNGDGIPLTDPDPGAPNPALAASANPSEPTSANEGATAPTLSRKVAPHAPVEREAVADPTRPGAHTSAQSLARAPGQTEAAEVPARGSAGSASGQETATQATKTAKTEAATKATPTPPPAKPITKAMAQAATKILNADELVASLPPKKTPPRVPPRTVRPSKPAPATAQAKSADPFDDRL
jgi:hypothetical protein